MDIRQIGFVLILIAVVVLSGAQVLIKSRLSIHGAIPLEADTFWPYLWLVAKDVRMWMGLAGLVISSLCWYAAISRLPLSIAYPFAALSYPVIFAGSLFILREAFSWQVMAGNALIVVGLILVATASRA